MAERLYRSQRIGYPLHCLISPTVESPDLGAFLARKRNGIDLSLMSNCASNPNIRPQRSLEVLS